MKPELSKLNKEEFKQEMRRREEEMKQSSKDNKIGLKRFTSAFFKKKVLKWLFAIFRACLIVGLSYIILYPVFNMLSRAFNTDYLGSSSSIWIPKSVGMNNINLALEYLDYWPAFWMSVKVSVGSAILQVIISAIVGYGFARFKFKGRGILFGIVILTMVVPPQTYLITMFDTYRNFDLFGILSIPELFGAKGMTMNLTATPWTMWIPAALGVGLRGGLFIYIFRQYFRGMSKDLEEAAYLDGCGPFATFLRIMAPNAMSSALVVFLFSLVWHWSDYFVQSMMFVSGTKTKPLTVMLITGYEKITTGGMFLTGTAVVNVTYILNASVLLAILPMILVFIVAQRFFIESVDKVGIKG